MYAAIRQSKAKAGMAEELARRIKDGAIPIISDVPGFRAYYVIYAPDDTVTAISIFDDYAGAQESNKRGLAWIEQNLAPLLTGRKGREVMCIRWPSVIIGMDTTEPGAPAHRAGHCGRRAGDRAYVGVVYRATSPARDGCWSGATQRATTSALDPAYPSAGRRVPWSGGTARRWRRTVDALHPARKILET